MCECGFYIESVLGVEYAHLPTPNKNEDIVDLHENVCPRYKEITNMYDNFIEMEMRNV